MSLHSAWDGEKPMYQAPSLRFYRSLLILLQVWPRHRNSHSIGPGIEVRDDPAERRRRNRGSMDKDVYDAASLE